MAARWVRDGGVWREVTALHVSDGGAWREAVGVGAYDGTWRTASRPAPPTAPGASDASACALGAPAYRVQVTWGTGAAGAATEVLVDGALAATASAGATSAQVEVVSHGTYAVAVRHARDGFKSAPAAAAPVTLIELTC